MGTTTAGMMVLRFDDDELLLVEVVGPGVRLLEDEECGFEEAEVIALAAAAALRLLYCDAFVMTEGAIYVVVEKEPSASDTRLCRVTDRVLNAVRAAADAIEVMTGAVTEVEIIVIGKRFVTVRVDVDMLFEHG
jgi:hypothetical protein